LIDIFCGFRDVKTISRKIVDYFKREIEKFVSNEKMRFLV
jgi:hypothetical protein